MEASQPTKLPAIQVVRHCFQDIDAFEAATRVSTDRDVKLTQLSLGQLQCEFASVNFGEARLTFIKPNCAFQGVGSKGKGFLDVACVLDVQEQGFLAHEYRVSPHTLSGMDANLEANFVAPKNQICFFAQFKDSLVRDCLEAMGRAEIYHTFWGNNFAYALDRMPAIRTYLWELLTVMQHSPQFLQQVQTRRLVLEDLLPLLLNALPTQDIFAGVSYLSRAQLAREAEAYMHNHLNQPLTIKALCDALHTSRGTLINACSDVFGLSPVAFLKVLRLQAVHHRLKLADPQTSSVTDIAYQYGFWSLGHFGRDYKAMFGELPKKTLKKKS